jgi:hypothetical protein
MRRACWIYVASMSVLIATSSSAWARRQVSTNQPSTSNQKTATYNPTMAGRSARNLLRNGRDYLSFQKYDRALELLREAQDKQVELDSAERALLKQSIAAAQRGLREDDGSRNRSKTVVNSSKNSVRGRSDRTRTGGFVAATPLLESDDVKSPIADHDDAVQRTRMSDDDPADSQPKPAPDRPKAKSFTKGKSTSKTLRSSRDRITPTSSTDDDRSVLNPRETVRPKFTENQTNTVHENESTSQSKLIQSPTNGVDTAPLIINDDDTKTDSDAPPPIRSIPDKIQDLPTPPPIDLTTSKVDDSSTSTKAIANQSSKNRKSKAGDEEQSLIGIGDAPLIINDDEPGASTDSSNHINEKELKEQTNPVAAPKLEDLPPLNVPENHNNELKEESGSTLIIPPLPVPTAAPNVNSTVTDGVVQEPTTSGTASSKGSLLDSNDSSLNSKLDLPPLPGENDRSYPTTTRIAEDQPERSNSTMTSTGSLNGDGPIEPAREVDLIPSQTPRSESVSMPDPITYKPKHGLSEESKREVERIARAQERESRSVPIVDLAREESAPGDTTTSGIVLPRAPSPTEARAIRPIPVPEEFVPLGAREWTPSRKAWAAAATCHLPLYFQDASLERYGHSAEQFFGPAGRYMSYPLDDPKESNQRSQILQPFMSFGLFIVQIAALPYNAVMDPPWEAEYDLGYYRPGDRVPTDVYYLPVTGVGPPLRGANYGK